MKRSTLLVIGLTILAVFIYGTFVASTALGVATVTIRGNLNKVTPGVSLVPITNQQVKVVCGGITKTATTNASGLYVTTFTEAGCVPSSPVSTKSAYNGSIITRQVWVSSENRATIDLLF